MLVFISYITSVSLSPDTVFLHVPIGYFRSFVICFEELEVRFRTFFL